MYQSYFSLHCPPFRLTPHPDFFYDGAGRGHLLQALLYAVDSGEGVIKVSGEVGAGKTMLCRMLLEKMPPKMTAIYFANPMMSEGELTQNLLLELAVPAEISPSKSAIRRIEEALIERYGAGQQVVVVVDEAHAMPAASLEFIRLLSNLDYGHHKLLQIVLFGQPELDQQLTQPAMRPLRERISYSFELSRLEKTDVAAYLHFRLQAAGWQGPPLFDDAAVKEIALAAQGLTRRINLLADKALLASFADNARTVSREHARLAVRECAYAPAAAFRAWPVKPIAVLATVAAVGIVFGLWYGARTTTASAQTVVAASAPLRVNSPAAVSSSSVASATTQIDVDGLPPALDQLAQHSRQQINAANAQTQTILLMTVPHNQLGELEKLMQRYDGQMKLDQVMIYPTQANGVKSWGVVYGLFADKRSAKQAMAQLPDALKRNKPLLRSVAGVREEIWTL
ncbi:AAA family ATPase [Chitinibacter bivalviorum]|uniref:AAA family ATPase n=1 Tax=Chitinibacter bivalviorum TaxID=2739434 RepID=A0A7H9BJF5_9NEIS|nr:AAA family ATPase [Chitinibacter bivalviorum]QLG88807.1 AAA family ATPase [Chitinibacter bivalviorum]